MGGLFGGSKKSNKPPPKPEGPQGYNPPEARRGREPTVAEAGTGTGTTVAAERQANRRRRLVAMGGYGR